MDRDARVRLFVDIGTNCEIVLGNREWLLATAAPAGPAVEGAAIRCGMRAATGAVGGVTVTPDTPELTGIGDAEPGGAGGSAVGGAGAGRGGSASSAGSCPRSRAARWRRAWPGG